MTATTVFGIILAHFVGDYILQSGWMANEKTKRWRPAIAHGLAYTLPFILVTQNPWALLIIGGTHIIIDRYRLAKYVTFSKEFIAPRAYWPTWSDSKDNAGFPSTVPPWLSFWLMFIADNTIHMGLNFAAIAFFGTSW